jgi:FkbM family methyltransferase
MVQIDKLIDMFDFMRTHGLTVANLSRVARNRGDARREAWRAGAFLLSNRVTPFVGVEHDSVRYLLSTSERTGVSFPTFIRGFFEEDAVRNMITALSTHAGISTINGLTVLEIGANIGTETVSFILRHGVERVIAIEPDAENARFLRANLALNSVEDRVLVHEIALSDADGMLVFEHCADNWGGHKVRSIQPGGVNTNNERDTTEVQGRCLDSLVEAGEIDLDAIGLVWIDAELHEANILDGAKRLTARRTPIVVEYFPSSLRAVAALDRFHALIAERFTVVVDLKSPDASLAAERVAEYAEQYPGASDYTNLLLLSS